VRVHEVGRLADNRTWFASEIVDGLTVAGMLELGALDPMTAVAIVRDAAEILAHAHQRGVVHGALTPDRIVLTSRLRGFPLCITDWSSARTHDAQSIRPATPGPYTAPELVRGELDDRADMFALGALAHRAFTGQVPDGAPLSSLAPELPRPLATLVEQMLAYDRWDRPSSAEIRSELAGLEIVSGEAAPGTIEPPTELRIRRPRWTPPLSFGSEDAAEALLDSAPTLDDITKRE